METTKPFRVLLYYKYVQIENPELFAKQHLKFCKELGLKGRILIASEGINGTVSGTIEQTEQYMQHMKQNPLFHDIWFKIDQADGHAFRKMNVRPRKELVTFNLEEDINPNEQTGKYLSPKEFYEALQEEDVIIIDGRNAYEYEIGHFRNALRPDIQATREFPEWIEKNLAPYKDKKILTYCTGGIRCEKLSGYLIREGFENVAQLHGGIVTYGKDPEVQGRLFDGKCFVFDDRIVVPINQTEEDVVISKCYHCAQPADKYINCHQVECDLLHIVCSTCQEKYLGFCSDVCQDKHHQQLESLKENSRN